MLDSERLFAYVMNKDTTIVIRMMNNIGALWDEFRMLVDANLFELVSSPFLRGNITVISFSGFSIGPKFLRKSNDT